MPIVTEQVELDVLRAALDAVRKHGELTYDPVRACAIMFRECGEAMNEALLLTYQGPIESDDRYHRVELLYQELAQVAATAMIIMTHIQEEQELAKLDA